MLPSVDRAPCGFVSVLDDGTMIAVNTTLAELLGYTRVELEGWHLQKVMPPGARIFYQTHVFPLLRMHGMVEEIYIALRTREGVDVPMLMNGVRRGGEVSDFAFMRMIQRHEFEDQLIAARRLAEQAGAAKAAFLSMMSHDLRTPLTSVSGYANLLAGGLLGTLSEEQLQAVQRIRESSDELLTLINDILGFAQLDSGRVTVRPKAVRIADAVTRASRLLHLRLEEEGLTFAFESCAEDAMVHADPDRLQQILLNLLTNATKFTPRGGRIVVSCSRAEDRMRISVRDTGIGISNDQRERIFEPFVQLDTAESHRGVGLGLAISRDLARAMGGEIVVDGEVGEGSTFTIELPVGQESG
jgi:PAS domain S-box-containing protein